jgi:DNA-binding transcriptional LysR family regulator
VPLDHTATVVASAQRIVADIAELSRWLPSVANGSFGRLRVGLIDIAAVHYFREAIKSFRSTRPELDINFTVAPTGALLEQLERSELDVAVCVDPEGVGSFDSTPLIRDDLAVYAPPSTSPKTLARPTSWGPWLLFPAGSRTRAAIDRHLGEIGAPLTASLESHQPDVLREMVGLGLGWTVLPTVQAERGPSPLRRVGRAPLLTRTISAVSRRGGARHPAVQTFIDELADRSDVPRSTTSGGRQRALQRGGESRGHPRSAEHGAQRVRGAVDRSPG